MAFAWAVGLVVAGFVTRLLSPILLRWVVGSLGCPVVGVGGLGGLVVWLVLVWYCTIPDVWIYILLD